MERPAAHQPKISTLQAEKLAVQEFKKQSKIQTTKFDVQLLEENKKEWVFVVEDGARPPAPGSELYVTINKQTSKVSSNWGK